MLLDKGIITVYCIFSHSEWQYVLPNRILKISVVSGELNCMRHGEPGTVCGQTWANELYRAVHGSHLVAVMVLLFLWGLMRLYQFQNECSRDKMAVIIILNRKHARKMSCHRTSTVPVPAVCHPQTGHVIGNRGTYQELSKNSIRSLHSVREKWPVMTY